jgi:hypothetical protein
MKCNLCGYEITIEEEAIYCLPFGAICEECSQDINEFGTSRIMQDEPTKETK